MDPIHDETLALATALLARRSVTPDDAGCLDVVAQRLTALGFVYALANQGSSWMIVTDRMQAMAAADGSFFGGFFGEFSERLHTPVRMNVLSGVVSTVFMVAAMLTKASIIGGNFMHLKFERSGLVLTVIVGLVVTGAILYVLIVPDAVRIHEMVEKYGPR